MTTPLVGRQAELAGLGAALERCRSGDGGVVLISGDAGTGKTRLLHEALGGWDGLLLRATALPSGGPYAPLVAALRLTPGARTPLAVEATLRHRSRGCPVAVVLDDLHHADAATVELLPALGLALADEPVLFLLTYRGEELPRAHPLRRTRTDLRRSGRLTEVALKPFTENETAQLLAGVLGRPATPALVSAVHAKAEGVPFVIEELAAAVVDAGAVGDKAGAADLDPEAALPLPDNVVDAVLARTADLRRKYPEAVEFAAMLGVRVDLPVLADLVPPGHLDGLLDAGLLSERGDGAAAFRHALVRDALYRAIPWARRRDHHRAVADVLDARGARGELIADHWLAAHEPERARPLLLAAAERCCALHAYRDATVLATRALADWPEDANPDGRTATIEKLAACAELCGELDEAMARWEAAARARRARGEPAAAAVALRRLANAAELSGDLSTAAAARADAVAAFGAAGLPGEAATERLALAEQLTAAASHSRALEHAEAAGEEADAAGRTDLKAHALALQGGIRTSLGEARRGVELARSGLELALAGQLIEAAGLSYYELASALINAADYAAAADAYGSAAELCRAHGATGLAQSCVACMAVAVRFLGDWDRALGICREVLDDDSVAEPVRMVAREEWALITVLRGDRQRARGPLRRAAEFGREQGIFGIEVGATWGLAVAAELDDDRPAALGTVSGMLDRCDATEDQVFALPAVRWASTFAAGEGEQELLGRCHRLLATAATQNGSPKVLSALAHAGGELALADGDAAQASAQFGRGVALLRGVTAPYEQALSQLRWGTALAANGDGTGAVETVTAAYRTARLLRAGPLARACASQLAAMGERVDRRLGRLAARALEPFALTRREKEVLRLLALGHTNRRIAQELFVSVRTVDMHVRNVLGKLGCSSRVAAARHAAELGLVSVAETRQ